jgi:hypothetical protein
MLLMFSSANARLQDVARTFWEGIAQGEPPRLGHTATRVVLLVGEIFLSRLAVCVIDGAVSLFFLSWDHWLIG